HSRELPPHFVCYSSSNSTPPISANNKELSHVPDRVIASDLRPFSHQNQSCQSAVDPNKKRMPVCLRPIKWQLRVAEPAILAQLYIVEFAEVVRVQLKQVGHNRLLLR